MNRTVEQVLDRVGVHKKDGLAGNSHLSRSIRNSTAVPWRPCPPSICLDETGTVSGNIGPAILGIQPPTNGSNRVRHDRVVALEKARASTDRTIAECPVTSEYSSFPKQSIHKITLGRLTNFIENDNRLTSSMISNK